MRTFRRLMIVIVALAAATPAMAQNAGQPTDPAIAPQTQTGTQSQQSDDNDKDKAGFGIGVQFGWLRSSSYSANNAVPTESLKAAMPGYMLGLWMGGHKGGAFGFGADINYVIKGATDVRLTRQDGLQFIGDLKLHYIEVPVMARINIGSRTTNGAAFYVLFGPVIDILLKGEIGSANVKDQFNGFDAGAVAGAGFEVMRIGVEGRFNWAFRTLQSTGNGTFLNGLEDSKTFTFVILAKVRFN